MTLKIKKLSARILGVTFNGRAIETLHAPAPIVADAFMEMQADAEAYRILMARKRKVDEVFSKSLASVVSRLINHGSVAMSIGERNPLPMFGELVKKEPDAPWKPCADWVSRKYATCTHYTHPGIPGFICDNGLSVNFDGCKFGSLVDAQQYAERVYLNTEELKSQGETAPAAPVLDERTARLLKLRMAVLTDAELDDRTRQYLADMLDIVK